MLNVFLDLESTVIDEFGKFPTFLMNKGIIINHALQNVGESKRLFIFSMAIYNEHDANTFRYNIKQDLLQLIGMDQVEETITVEEMMKVSQDVNKFRFDDMFHFIQIGGKEAAFHDWCHRYHVGQRSILIDDMVPTRTTIDHVTRTRILTINIEKMVAAPYLFHNMLEVK